MWQWMIGMCLAIGMTLAAAILAVAAYFGEDPQNYLDQMHMQYGPPTEPDGVCPGSEYYYADYDCQILADNPN